MSEPQIPQSRIGKKSVTIWIDEDLAEAVKIAAIRAGESQQDWFANAAHQRLGSRSARKSEER